MTSQSVAIVGSRTFNDYDLLKQTMKELDFTPSKIVSGGATGADSLGAKYGKENSIPVTIFKPDWTKHGKSAGFIRNTDIVLASDIVIAFWDGKSNGTRDTINKAKKESKQVIIVTFSP